MNPTPEQLADAELEMTEARDKVADLGAALADLFSHRLGQHNARLQAVPVPRASAERLVAAVERWRVASADFAVLYAAAQGRRMPPSLQVFTAADDREAAVAEAVGEGGAA